MAFMRITSTDYGPTSMIQPDADGGFCVTATTEAGEVYLHKRGDLDEADAQNLAKVVGLAKQINPEHWVYWRTVYGSDAFLQEEAEAAHAAQMIRDGYAQEADFAGTSIGELI